MAIGDAFPEWCFKRLSRSRNDIFALFNQKNVKVYRQDRPASGEGETRRAWFGGHAKNVGYQVVISRNATRVSGDGDIQRGFSRGIQQGTPTITSKKYAARSEARPGSQDCDPAHVHK
jgi:hypothetical protein